MNEPLLADEPLFVPQMLNYAPSWFCQSRCRHCCVPLRSRRKDDFQPIVARRLLRDLPEFVRIIGFTGGEPLARPERILELIGQVHRIGRVTEVVTHAFRVYNLPDWEFFFRQAISLGLASISLSIDEYHRPVVKLPDMVELVRRFLDLGLQVHLKGIGKASREMVRAITQCTGLDRSLSVAASSSLDNVGTARRLPRDRVRRPERHSCVGIMAPLVTPSGDVMACCSSYLEAMNDTPIYRGNMMKISLSEILDSYSRDYLVGAIAFYGPFGVRRLVGWPPLAEDPGRCEACLFSLRDNLLVEALRTRLSRSKELRKKIAGALLAWEKFYRPRFVEQVDWSD